jgi:hypothetical protein
VGARSRSRRDEDRGGREKGCSGGNALLTAWQGRVEEGGRAVGGGHAMRRGWGWRGGPVPRSGSVGRPAPAQSQHAWVGNKRSRGAGEVGTLTGEPQLQFWQRLNLI